MLYPQCPFRDILPVHQVPWLFSSFSHISQFILPHSYFFPKRTKESKETDGNKSLLRDFAAWSANIREQKASILGLTCSFVQGFTCRSHEFRPSMIMNLQLSCFFDLPIHLPCRNISDALVQTRATQRVGVFFLQPFTWNMDEHGLKYNINMCEFPCRYNL